jgi:DNA topoisomerase II
MRKTKKKGLAEIYQKKTPIEHILLRPDTYIGSIEVSTSTLWVWEDESSSIVKKTINFVPGLYKIFDEILVNAIDNFHKCPDKMDAIKVTIDREENMISIWNNGETIPVEMHPEEKIY